MRENNIYYSINNITDLYKIQISDLLKLLNTYAYKHNSLNVLQMSMLLLL